MPYLRLRGVESYHEVAGDGPPVVLLHGGGCSLEELRPLAESLGGAYRVHAAERPGHGRTPDREGPYSYAEAVADTLAYLDALGLADAHLVGFSDGAIIGLLLARDHPGRVRSLVPIAANLDPGGLRTDGSERAMPTGLAHEIEVRNAALSPGGAELVARVEGKLHALWEVEPRIPATSLATITAPTLVMAGQHDLVALEHTALIARSVPGAELCIVPGTGHLLVVERPAFVSYVVRGFLDTVCAGSPIS
ncbi:alpha/beta hydrolase [Nocardioides sp. BP30]|uniref:alpha/beta fold hydrolase n=1 Tax=Nocardioides sp. BP30 TaxID=3036374 RepID=UPI002468D413|nr:alpha/beta hydrolase [Nocardioides sp. BP30]WGL53551.1 alpha/beta hydrolase [Nocardioides sp. BP30]